MITTHVLKNPIRASAISVKSRYEDGLMKARETVISYLMSRRWGNLFMGTSRAAAERSADAHMTDIGCITVFDYRVWRSLAEACVKQADAIIRRCDASTSDSVEMTDDDLSLVKTT